MQPVTCMQCRADVGPDALYVIGQGNYAVTYCEACAKTAHPWLETGHTKYTTCPVCGRKRYYSGAELWPRMYCTEACQQQARRERRRHPRTHQDFVCATCGQRFTATRTDARYCSVVCRQKPYRARAFGRRLEALIRAQEQRELA